VLIASRRSAAEILHLPGRDWALLLGPTVGSVQNMTIGYSTFPAGSAPTGHTHAAEEEIVYVVAGRGQLVALESVVELEAGVAVYIPPGTEHATRAYAGQDLELLTMFSPPVVPGSYEPEHG